MEIELDKRIMIAGALIIIIIVLLLLYSLYSFIAGLFVQKPVEQKYDYKTQLEFLRWSICERTDAIQMYLQEPDSNHPNVQKLRYDINLYDRMASELRKDDMAIKNFSVSDCEKNR